MKSSIQVILFFLLGLVASLALPFKRQSPTQFSIVDFSGGAVRDIASFCVCWWAQLADLIRTGLPLDLDVLPVGGRLLLSGPAVQFYRRRGTVCP